MAEYIERQKVFDSLPVVTEDKTISLYGAVSDFIVYVSAIPSADVAPVRHGRWIERKSFHAEGGISAKCSACQKDVQYLGNPLKYCPNCGAKMDLEE